LVIALRPTRHNRLLIGEERAQFTALAEELLATVDPRDGSIPWSDLLDLFAQREALRTGRETTLARGRRLDEVRKAFPACDPRLIKLIHKAAATLREFQSLGKPDSTDGQEVLSAFNEDKRTLCGATS
jgi:hypothetical protein